MNPEGGQTIDFANAASVKLLNKALLKYHYQIEHWDIPPGFLCPPVPGRADYVHHIADLIAEDHPEVLERKSKRIQCLDIGTGANCIYPILGNRIYGWKFVASDISERALINAQAIIKHNRLLKGNIELVFQKAPKRILKGIIESDDFFHAVFCNPPFYASEKEAQQANQQKNSNLTRTNKDKSDTRNFGGQHQELWTNGGELQFIKNYIQESTAFAKNVGWFSSLVADKNHIPPLTKALNAAKVKERRIIELATGNKVMRVLAWRW